MVTLTGGITFQIDSEDSERVSAVNWRICPEGYLRGTIGGKRVYLHRWLIGAEKGQMVDHIDGNRLNNQRSNLRLCTSSGNNANRAKLKPALSKYKGVSFDRNRKRNKRWMARCQYAGKSITIGRFFTEEEAARAYDETAKKLWGAFAKLNFQ